jgi:hypothetical protein
MVKKKMLVELCVGNCGTSDSIVDGVDWIFEDCT